MIASVRGEIILIEEDSLVRRGKPFGISSLRSLAKNGGTISVK